MSGIALARHIHIALSSDYLAFRTDFFDRCFDFHKIYSGKYEPITL